MKKLTTVMLSVALMLTMFMIIGCESDTDNDIGIIGVEILNTNPEDSVSFGGTVDVTVKLTGFTFEYKQINYYFGSSEVPAAVYTKDQLNSLANLQEKNAEFTYAVSTDGLEAGWTELTVEAVANDLRTASGSIPLKVIKPTDVDTNLDLSIISPLNNAEFRIGDIIQVTVGIEGNITMFENLSAYINASTDRTYYTETGSPTILFSFSTVNFPVGPLSVKVVLKTKDGLEKQRSVTLNLIEYIPTFGGPANLVLGEAGYELKSLIQTYDKCYLTVSSSPSLGTKIAKYNEEGQLITTFGTGGVVTLAAAVGIGVSVCEDTEYDKGYVIAGWRQNGSHTDTWVRKINNTNGSLIWNKTYGYDFADCLGDGPEPIDDAATVIRKTKDDGYIIGGYTKNIFGTDSLKFG